MLIETKQNDLLTWLGDQLDATDEVREQNGIGFNSLTKALGGMFVATKMQ